MERYKSSYPLSPPSLMGFVFIIIKRRWLVVLDIDLTSLQKSLDATASEIVGGQKEGLVQRKELAQKTKEFRKLDEEARKEEWKGLLKCLPPFLFPSLPRLTCG